LGRTKEAPPLTVRNFMGAYQAFARSLRGFSDPPRQKSCIEAGPLIIPRPDLFIGIAGLEHQIIPVPRTDDLEACGEAILCKTGRC
jgi:hypothetical protein